MTGICLKLLVLAVVLATPVVFALLRVLQGRWGLPTVTDAALYLVATRLPASGQDPQALLRKISRRLRGVTVATASSGRGAAARVTILLGADSHASLFGYYTDEPWLAGELAQVYTRHATQQHWKMPTEPITVAFAIDDALRPGWVRMHATPGAYRTMTTSAERRAPDRTRLLPAPAPEDTRVLVDADELDADHTRVAEPLFILLPQDGTAPTQLPVAGQDLTVGRGSGCELRLAGAPLVSRAHAVLSVRADRLLVRDLQSTNGTWVNDVRIREATSLLLGDHVSFGQAGPRFTLARSPELFA